MAKHIKMEQKGDIALEVRDLRIYFFTRQGIGKAVDGVNFSLPRTKTLGLVGESGCGKTLTALAILGLVPKPVCRIVGGQILFNGEDLLKKSKVEMRRYRGRYISMILQDPMTALNPVFTIGEQVMEPMRIHQNLQKNRLKAKAIEMLKLLHIPVAESRLGSYPHEFSGGMRQRVVGAVSLSCNPELIIADEPTTSLDVTIQAQYLRLLREIQKSRGLSIIFITHDFGIIERMCDWVAVMYAGRVVEMATTEELFQEPIHPYTQALLNSVPIIGPGPKKRLYAIEGQPPSIYKPLQGCSFAPRCPSVMDQCWLEYPPVTVMRFGHTSSCWKLSETHIHTHNEN